MNSNPRTELWKRAEFGVCRINYLTFIEDILKKVVQRIDLLIDSPILVLYKRCDFSRWPVSVRTVIVITRNNMHANVGHI